MDTLSIQFHQQETQLVASTFTHSSHFPQTKKNAVKQDQIPSLSVSTLFGCPGLGQRWIDAKGIDWNLIQGLAVDGGRRGATSTVVNSPLFEGGRLVGSWNSPFFWGGGLLVHPKGGWPWDFWTINCSVSNGPTKITGEKRFIPCQSKRHEGLTSFDKKFFRSFSANFYQTVLRCLCWNDS